MLISVRSTSVSARTNPLGTGAPDPEVTVTFLHSFTGGVAGSSDSALPVGSLTQGADGALYGVTTAGGVVGVAEFGSIQYGATAGTIFKITPPGIESVQYSFAATSPLSPNTTALAPQGDLIQAPDGSFYGSSSSPTACGAVFHLNTAGSLKVLYSFSDPVNTLGEGCQDTLNAGVIHGIDGNFYIASSGQDTDEGTAPSELLRITPDGQGTDVATFPVCTFGGVTTNLIQVSDGTFYETVGAGTCFGQRQGAVLKISPSTTNPNGAVTVLHSFGETPNDGASPMTALLQASDGNFYGTTAAGGNPSPACPNGCGIVYKLSPAGTETVLYSFGESAVDGQTPSSALIQAKDGNFYGTTSAGGTASCGTLYRITPSGVETVLFSFGSPYDGCDSPMGSLLQAGDGSLYGMAQGGVEQLGVVFRAVIGSN